MNTVLLFQAYFFIVTIYVTQCVFCIQELKEKLKLIDPLDPSPMLRDIKYNIYKCYDFDSNAAISDRIYSLIVGRIKEDESWIKYKDVILPKTINMVVCGFINKYNLLRKQYKKYESKKILKCIFTKHLCENVENIFNEITDSIKIYMNLSNEVLDSIGNDHKTKIHMYDMNLCILHKALCLIHDIVFFNKVFGCCLGKNTPINIKTTIHDYIQRFYKMLFDYLAKNILKREYYYFVIKDCNTLKSLIFNGYAYKDIQITTGNKFSSLNKFLKIKPDKDKMFCNFEFCFKASLAEIKKEKIFRFANNNYDVKFIYDWCELTEFYEENLH